MQLQASRIRSFSFSLVQYVLAYDALAFHLLRQLWVCPIPLSHFQRSFREVDCSPAILTCMDLMLPMNQSLFLFSASEGWGLLSWKRVFQMLDWLSCQEVSSYILILEVPRDYWLLLVMGLTMSLPTDRLVAGCGVFLLWSSTLLIYPCRLISSRFLNYSSLLLSSSNLIPSSCLLSSSCNLALTTTSQFSSILFLVRTIWISLVISATNFQKYLRSLWLSYFIWSSQFSRLARSVFKESMVWPACISWARRRAFYYRSSLFSLSSSLSTLSSQGENSSCVGSLKDLHAGEYCRLVIFRDSCDFLQDEIRQWEFCDLCAWCELDRLEKVSLQCLRRVGLLSCLEKSARYLYLASKCLSGFQRSSWSAMSNVIICPLIIRYRLEWQHIKVAAREGKSRELIEGPCLMMDCLLVYEYDGAWQTCYLLSRNEPYLRECADEASQRQMLLAADAEPILDVSQSIDQEALLLTGHPPLDHHQVNALQDGLKGNAHFFQH